jgi:RNA-binding protein
MIKLTPAERSALRAEAHGLNPVVMIGEAGLSESVMKEISPASMHTA